MKMYDIANYMARHLARETELEQSKVDRLRFGLELLIGEIIKFAILLSTAALLGLLPETVAAMAGLSIFRLLSGGAHCEDYWRCLVFGMLVYVGASVAGVYVSTYISKTVLTMSVIVGVAVLSLMVLIWAPGEVPERKIKQGDRGLFKILSIAFLFIWAVVLIFILSRYSISVSLAGLLGSLVQAFSFTPLGYRTIGGFDITLSKIIGERRCPNNAENA